MPNLSTRYLNLLKSALTDTLGTHTLSTNDGHDFNLTELLPNHPRFTGDDWPSFAHTMVGLKRLNQYQQAIETVVNDRIPGDIIECGCWRGGCAILAAAVLDVLGCTDKRIWVSDSFAGLPPPDVEADSDSPLHKFDYLAVSLAQVQAAFTRFGVNDKPVRYIQGWFKDTLPRFQGAPWSIIRADGDMFSSTMDILTNLYPGLSPGGILIIDDYFHIPACKQAVEQYRAENSITEEIVRIDAQGAYWRRKHP
jgi:hypothetical protein